MFHEYLVDSVYFIENARLAELEGDTEEVKRLYRVAVFCSMSSLEAYVNFIADAFEQAGTLDKNEIAFLNDKAIRFDPSFSGLTPKTNYHKLDEKIKFLVKRFNGQYNFQGAHWSRFMELKALRDSLIHPRSDDDKNTPNQYEKKLIGGITAVINIMSSLSKIVLRRKLRRNILDLIPNNKGQWT